MKVDGRERIESSASARFFSVSDEPHVDGSGELTVPITVHVQDDPSNASQTMVGGEAMMGISEDPPNTSQTIFGGGATKDVVKLRKRRRHSEGDIRREDEEGLPNSKRVEKSPKSRKRGRPLGNNKTGSTGGNAGDPDLPTASQRTVQRKSSREEKIPMWSMQFWCWSFWGLMWCMPSVGTQWKNKEMCYTEWMG